MTELDRKQFPLISPDGIDLTGLNMPDSIPWGLLNEEWAQRNHGQSLSILAQRGGLDPTEVAAIIERRRWRPMFLIDALQVMGVKT
jgi:hypothetical protein